jgi:hypothetical protein
MGTPNGDSSGATSIAFSDESVVLIPGQARTLSLTVTPPAAYTVRLALVGEAADAYLDTSELVTDDAGRGSFTLTAPSSPKSFSVRASVGKQYAEIQATPATGYTTVEVVPVYSGHRKITDWVGTVSIGSSCDTTVVPPPDGPLSATAPDHPRIGDVPLGTPLTVTIRAGHFAGGCVELSRVVADSAGGAYTVSVPAQDRPISLDGVSVPLVLGVDTTQGWSSVWTDLATNIQNAFCPSPETDVSALLDAMHDATPLASQSEFTTARTLHLWDEKLLVSLDSGLAKHGLDDAVNRWITDGLKALSDSPLVGRLSTNSSATPALSFSKVGGFAPKDVGFPATLTDGVSLTASPDDHVVFGATTPKFEPGTVAAALALSAAQKEFPDAKSVPEALATLVGCDSVGAILVGTASTGYGTCNAVCLAQRCNDALTTMWKNATTGGDSATLEVSGSAAVTSLSDSAAPLALDGTWVGTMRVGTSSTHVGGAVASAPAAAP